LDKFNTEFIQKGKYGISATLSSLKEVFQKINTTALVDFFRQIQVGDQQKIYLKRR